MVFLQPLSRLREGPPLLFVALDLAFPAADALATRLARSFPQGGVGVKIGLELYNAVGIAGVRQIREYGLPVFLDLKFHDIPNTVARAIESVCREVTPFCLTVHASGGTAMLRAAVAAAAQAKPATSVIAVTVLTSLDQEALAEIGQGEDLTAQVLRLKNIAITSGCAGIVCAPQELHVLAKEKNIAAIVPGIRPKGSDPGDQKRFATPEAAIIAGADHLVIGRPITEARDPISVTQTLVQEIQEAATHRISDMHT